MKKGTKHTTTTRLKQSVAASERERSKRKQRRDPLRDALKRAAGRHGEVV